MLFDLRGRGRRNVIKVIYLGLALLMGGGLVLFGIGSSTSGNPIQEILGTGDGQTGSDTFDEDIAAAKAKLQTDDKDEAAWVDLIRAQVSLAATDEQYDSNTGVYNAAGQADLRDAVGSWEAYQAIKPSDKEAEGRVAAIVVRAYISLQDLEGATDAQEILAINREAVGPYSTLAELAYAAGQTRKGDLAARKAIQLEDPDQREVLRQRFDSIKAQSAPQAIPSVTVAPETSATAEPSATKAPKAGAKSKAKKK